MSINGTAFRRMFLPRNEKKRRICAAAACQKIFDTLHQIVGKGGQNPCFHEEAILRYATEDGDAREARDGTAVTKRKRSVSENADNLRRNNKKKRRFFAFSSDKYSFINPRRKWSDPLYDGLKRRICAA